MLTLIARGLCNSEIEHDLHVSRGTVKTHIGRLLAKLDARDRAQLVIVGYETGLVAAPGRQRHRHQIESDIAARPIGANRRRCGAAGRRGTAPAPRRARSSAERRSGSVDGTPRDDRRRGVPAAA